MDGWVAGRGAGHRIDGTDRRHTRRQGGRGSAGDGALVFRLILARVQRRRPGDSVRSPVSRLAQRARDFGLSFASAHLAHLGLVAWLFYFSATPFPRAPLILFSVAVFWTYLLALLSIGRVAAKLSPRLLRILRTVGVEYIALVFLFDFAKNPFQAGIVHLLIYLPFLALAVAGPVLRLAAVMKRMSQARALAM